MTKSFDRYRMPDELWNRMEMLLPDRPCTSRKGGRPRLQQVKPVADAIFYKMRTGCQWNALPRVFGASSTIHDYFQEWVELGIFERMWDLSLTEYEELRGTSWQHQSLDTATLKAPLGGKKLAGIQPTGASLAANVPSWSTGAACRYPAKIAGANIHDVHIVQTTLKKRKYRRQRNRRRKRMHMHFDKGYDSAAARTTARRHGYIPHAARRKRRDRRGRPVTRRDIYRWVVERTHAWANRFRGYRSDGRKS
ncbi:MAG TPA: IS5 family transposase [Oligoflexus sp.]|uniref:IS5 family transposase n=1 Tax=Oligoflexus sp. TaxID=1971216 RepID=UPI002D393394|nr:IS5 family transposase [Oligoflexus sp.]HYX35797.1 IS5 family transposase [Oligoflexus sp.]